MANINGTNRNDIINATAGNDAINGGAGDDTINAGEGNNAVDGGSGNDSITAGAGNDVIDGGSGNDVINAGNGNNTVDGGSGNDNITTGSGNDSIDGESGNDTIFAGAGKDVILAGEGNDTVYGQDGDDVIYGEAGDDLLDGGDGNDYINGGDGRDIVYGGKGSDRLVGADQNDTLYGGSGDDVIGVDDAWRCNFSRENGQDVIYGDGKNSASGAWLSGADEVGSDLIYSGRGNDRIYGDSGLGGTVGGNDRIYAGGGNDAVFGEGGNDVIYGEDGDDLIDGGAGDDTLKGGDGRDTVYGGAGGDIISGADGRDLLYGGSGDDRIGNNDDNSWRHGYFSESGGDIIYGDGKDSASGLAGATGNDFIFSGQGNDTLYGDNGNNFAGAGAGGADTIYAGSGNDTAYGEGGDDALFGEKGNDSLYGGSGADEIAGGLGADTLSGGSGADTFIFTAELNQHSHRGWHGWGGWHGGYDHYDLQSWSDSTTMGMDTITDFLSIKDLGSNPLIAAGGPDKIDLVQLLGDDVDLKWGGTTPTAYGVWFKHEGGNTYVYADISGNPAVAELAFKLTGIHHLVVGDFLGVSSQGPIANADSNASDPLIEAGGAANAIPGDPSASGNVLANDTDPDLPFDTLTVSAVNGNSGNVGAVVAGTYGSLTLYANGSYSYALNNADSDTQGIAQGQIVNDVFNYTIMDSAGQTSTATLTLSITGTNDRPVVSNVAAAATEDGSTVNGSFVVSDADTSDLHTFAITSAPSAGSVVNNNDGTFTFDPGSDFQDLADGETRDVSFTYTATDDSGTGTDTSLSGTVTITVTGTNDRPVVSNVAAAATEDGSTVNGSFVVSDADTSDLHTFAITSAPSAGSVVNNNDGTFTFDPGSDFQDLADGETRDVSFTYTATDDSGTGTDTSLSGTVTITVTGTNDRPVVSNVAAAAAEDGSTVNGSFVVSDADTSDLHTFAITSAPSAGSVVNNNDGTFTFDPGSDFQDLADGETRDVSFTYTATDDSGTGTDTSLSGTVTITVTGTNDRPVVSNVAAAATEDGSTVNGSFVVSDADTSDLHTFAITSAPSAGSVVNNNDGTFTFDPGSDFQDLADGETRDVSFTYTATDDSGTGTDTSLSGTVTITVTGTNDRPVVSNVAAAATEDGSTVNGSFVVSDADTSDLHTFAITSAPSAGSVVNNNDGTFTFDPGSDFQDLADGETRDVSFTYTATDDSGTGTDTSLSGTVTITVTGTNDRPVVSNVAAAAAEDGSTVNGSFVVSDADTSDLHTFAITSAPSAGSVVNNNDGTFTFDPGSDFQDLADGETRDVSFTYTATDDSGTGTDTSLSGTVTITVTGTNDRPVVSNVAAAAAEDGSTVNGSFVVSDADTSDLHTFAITSAPSAGSVVNNNDGTFTFDPGSDFQDLADGETRDVSFTYTATDDSGTGTDTSLSGTVTITVTGTNDRPVVSNVAAAAAEDGSTVNGSFVVSDADTSDLHTFAITSAPSAGSVVNNNDGTFTFDPGSDFQDLADGETRDVSFTYTATDDSGTGTDTSLSGTVTITVTGTNDRPVVSNVAAAAAEDGSTVNGSFVVSDADTSDLHTFAITSAPSAGSVVNNNDGTFTFDPGSDFQDLADGETRDVSFTYTATDDSGTGTDTSLSGTVTITVTGTNDRPVVSNVAAAATEDGSTVNGSFVVSDADTSDLHTFAITSAPSAGSVVNNNDGTFTFDPGSDFQDLADGETRDVSFTYTATDDSGTGTDTSLSGTVTITVTGTNDRPVVSNVAAAATEDGSTVNGSFVVSDADTSDLHTFAITSAPSAGSV
ncbi:VCBS domain-containing protein [Aeromonas rivipollensis]|uniref:VCBS domain-containing protein n=1 Tax=Aeromonas rivipollensis TaxID=948519 RepID=UPI000D12FEAB|nr:Ig-like domain-containing protein [Aeromonas rivipollensis]AVP93802.1 hypothetical protein C7N77_11800 [Aeromonas rivipollensis]